MSQMGDINSKNLFLTFQEAEKSESSILEVLNFSENPFPGSKMTVFSVSQDPGQAGRK